MDMLCSDKSGKLTQNIMTVEWKLPWCETSEQGLLSFALLASEWTRQNPLLRLVVTIMRRPRRMWMPKCCRMLNGASGV